jgi:4-diphosphocytidyl-2-C-methyl-D-erythritol kinase
MPQVIREFAAAKINLALHVTGRRDDGYHQLDSIVAFADVGDGLDITPAAAFGITVGGPFAAQLPPSTDNIIQRAHAAAAQRVVLPPVQVKLEKNLPVSSGIGGGSADAAAMLRACFRLGGKPPAPEDAAAMALSLGADVPVCLFGKACRMQGVGERITPLAGFKPLPAVLVNPGVAVPTAAIFAAMGIARGATHRSAIAPDDTLATWRNDLTEAALALAPDIGEVLSVLRTQPGLTAARMSGSGATCFGIFETAAAAGVAARAIGASHPRWWCVATTLQ